MKIIDDFIPKENFKEFKNLITNYDFPWRINRAMTDHDNCIWFSHDIFDDHQIFSPVVHGKYFIKILNQLHCAALINGRLNLYCNATYQHSGWHNDFLFVCKTAIFNFDNNDGGTEFMINDEIKFVQSKANSLIVFDSNIKHRAVSSNKNDLRHVLNFNFIDTYSMFIEE